MDFNRGCPAIADKVSDALAGTGVASSSGSVRAVITRH
jgi:hypothetical protein